MEKSMSRRVLAAAGAIALSLGLCAQVFAQEAVHKGTIITPSSSIEKPGDIGQRAHTNFVLFVPADATSAASDSPVHPFQFANPQAGGPPFTGYLIEAPGSVACIYKLTKAVAGCNPNTATTVPTGGSKAIAIVDAYHNPDAASDLASFSTQFGLPAATFQVVYQGTSAPPEDPTGGWEIEESLDVQWAHAMAPNAKIYLVECNSNSFSDLLAGVAKASSLVSAAGGGEVSMSWGGSEFTGENSYDSDFTTSNVVYFAATGDAPGTIYPSVSPNVVAVGGTSFRRSPTSPYAFKSEAAWSETGGGPSEIEARPSYQASIASKVGSVRGVPDVAALADPDNSVWVLDNEYPGGGGWFSVGGTSLATPTWAGIVNAAGSFAKSTNAELTTLYGDKATDFKNTTYGFCGPYNWYSASTGWDFCTGNGSPVGYTGK